jgi:hypothetical protein
VTEMCAYTLYERRIKREAELAKVRSRRKHSIRRELSKFSETLCRAIGSILLVISFRGRSKSDSLSRMKRLNFWLVADNSSR